MSDIIMEIHHNEVNDAVVDGPDESAVIRYFEEFWRRDTEDRIATYQEETQRRREVVEVAARPVMDVFDSSGVDPEAIRRNFERIGGDPDGVMGSLFGKVEDPPPRLGTAVLAQNPEFDYQRIKAPYAYRLIAKVPNVAAQVEAASESRLTNGFVGGIARSYPIGGEAVLRTFTGDFITTGAQVTALRVVANLYLAYKLMVQGLLGYARATLKAVVGMGDGVNPPLMVESTLQDIWSAVIGWSWQISDGVDVSVPVINTSVKPNTKYFVFGGLDQYAACGGLGPVGFCDAAAQIPMIEVITKN